MKTELKGLQHSPHTIALSKGTRQKRLFFFFFAKKKKNADISKIRRALELKGIFSETTHVCVPTYQNSSF